jgi:hypothetical protein
VSAYLLVMGALLLWRATWKDKGDYGITKRAGALGAAGGFRPTLRIVLRTVPVRIRSRIISSMNRRHSPDGYGLIQLDLPQQAASQLGTRILYGLNLAGESAYTAPKLGGKVGRLAEAICAAVVITIVKNIVSFPIIMRIRTRRPRCLVSWARFPPTGEVLLNGT